MNVGQKKVRKPKIVDSRSDRKRKHEINGTSSNKNHIPLTRSRGKINDVQVIKSSTQNNESLDEQSEIDNNSQSNIKKPKLNENFEEHYNYSEKLKSIYQYSEKENFAETRLISPFTNKEWVDNKLVLKDKSHSNNNHISDLQNVFEDKSKHDFSRNKALKENKSHSQMESINNTQIDYKNYDKHKPLEVAKKNNEQVNKSELNEGTSNWYVNYDSSLNDVCSFINNTSQINKFNEEAKDESCSNVLSSWGSFTLPKKSSKRKGQRKVDPVKEKKRQNYEW